MYFYPLLALLWSRSGVSVKPVIGIARHDLLLTRLRLVIAGREQVIVREDSLILANVRHNDSSSAEDLRGGLSHVRRCDSSDFLATYDLC